MGKTRKPIPVVPPPVKSRKRARQITTAFHKLTKQAAQLKEKEGTIDENERQAQLAHLEKAVSDIGGREAYQSASLLSVAHHNTSKWVTQQIAALGLQPAKVSASFMVLQIRPSIVFHLLCRCAPSYRAMCCEARVLAY
jgi:25S rRNA (adenine2142-N1)-methyltransferase